MRQIEDLGIIGTGWVAEELTGLAGVAGYRVHRIHSGLAAAHRRGAEERPRRLDALCVCVRRPAEVFGVVAEFLRLDPELRPAHLLNMTAIGPNHARRADRLLSRLEPTVEFAECPLVGSARTLRRHEATLLYGSRTGPPQGALTRLLLALAGRVIVLGDVAKASAGTLLSNALATSIALVALEGCELGRESGLSVKDCLEVMPGGPDDGSFLRDCLNLVLLDRNLGAGFRARATQDMKLALAVAGERGRQPAFAALACQLLGDRASSVEVDEFSRRRE